MAAAGQASQTDARLDGLFAQLRAAADAPEAARIEGAIWRLWTEAGDPATDSLMTLGIAAMASGDLRGALAVFDAVTRQSPEFAEGWNKRATVLYLLGAYDASAADVEKTLALEPRHFGALSGLGLINLARERKDEALKAFEAALAINPHMPGVRQNVDTLRRRGGAI
ncbi:MAG: tetratricopeptide repeat protein [Rhodospirillales bacterium]|nr:tetratricopeptide repeat protein [Rhodospirillales bacterium]